MEQHGRPVATNIISGAIHGPTVQAASIAGGVHFHLTDGHVERPVPVDQTEGWEGLPELPVEVRSLLRAQVQGSEELPYRLPGARRPSLATVYVRQDLGSGSEDPAPEQPRPTPMLDARGQLTDPPSRPVVRLTVRPPTRTVREVLDGNDHVVVTGGPGQGKSTLSLRLAADLADRWRSPDGDATPLAEQVVPLRLTARELAARLGLPFPEAVAESVRVEYGALLGTSLDARVVGARVAGCRWLLLVDGLDEVADSADRNRLVKVLAAWAGDVGSPYRVLLTTRPIEGTALAPLQRIGAARYELQPFDDEALRIFAENWFDDGEDATRFVRQARAAQLDELVRVPLLATIAAIIFEQHRDRPLPDNQYELYEAYLKYLRSAHPETSSPFDEARDPLLEHLGRVRLEADTSLVAAAHAWVVRHVPVLTGNWQDELTTYLSTVGPLVRRGEDLRFLHHSFAEHLAATAKARLLPEHFDPEHADFARLLHAARPKERGRHARAVLVHYTRLRAGAADRLIGWLHTGGADQHLLAARLLASHVPAGAAVVDAFLSTVRAWAMTTQYRGDEILSQASRATHHPGIAEWLADLMRDEDTPWQSRVETATALATRLRGTETREAIALLSTVVHDATVPVEHRLAAAEALSECGGGERGMAEQGLRLVLADPSATALNCRKAAVTLASFGGAARTHAVEALAAMLDDEWTPDDDLVEAATGLVEIGVEFHERCAEVFRTVLDHRADYSNADLRDAAIGLASLGAQELAEAVAALTRLIADRRLGHFDRLSAAETLAELGPHHRVAAGEQLLAISAEIGVEPDLRRSIAASLARVGFHDHALDLLRAVLAKRPISPQDHLSAARALATLGPNYREEAARIVRRVTGHPMSSEYEYIAALVELVTLGEPYRTVAMDSLRGIVGDRNADPAFRCRVAAELARLGPDFHAEVAEHVLEIASCQTDPDIRVKAWRVLRDLGADFRDRGSAALLALIGPDEAESWAAHRDYPTAVRSDADDYESLAQALTVVLRDPARSGEARIAAAGTLADLGRRFDRIALDGVTEMLRSHAVPASEFSSIATTFSRLGPGPRAKLAGEFREMISQLTVPAETVLWLAEALDALGYRSDPAVITALRRIVDDRGDSDTRAKAAVALARTRPDELAEAAAVVLRSDLSIYGWQRQVRELASLGAEVVPGIRALMSDVDSSCYVREMSAVLLAQLCPELREEASAELRAQAGDEFLTFLWRTDAVMRLVEITPDTTDDAIAYHQAVLDDESQPVTYRCRAAYQLAQFDESLAVVVKSNETGCV